MVRHRLRGRLEVEASQVLSGAAVALGATVARDWAEALRGANFAVDLVGHATHRAMRQRVGPAGAKMSEAHTVRVPVIVGTGVRITCRRGRSYFADRDDTGWTAVHAELTACADIIIDDEHHRIGRVCSWKLSPRCGRDGRRSDHVDALPWANIYASLAGDALRLVDVNELLGFNRFGEIRSIYFYEVVLGGPLWHRGVSISARHVSNSPRKKASRN